jgi:hypothetical protein
MCCKDNVDLYIGKTDKIPILKELFGWSELQSKLIMEKITNDMKFVKEIPKDQITQYSNILFKHQIPFKVEQRNSLK